MFIREVGRKYHHTPEQVRDYLNEAWRALEDSDVPQEHYGGALPALVTLLASSQVWYEQGQAVPHMAIPRNSG